MPGLDFLYSPNSQWYNARQNMIQDDLRNQQADLSNQTSAAALPGIIGQSQSLAAKGQLDSANMPDKIKAQQQELLSKMDEGQAKQLAAMGNKMGQIGGLLENVPPVLRQQYMQQVSQKFGLSGMPDLSNVPQEELPATLQKMGKSMALATESWYQKQAELEQQEKASTERQKIASEGTVKAAQARADATTQNAATAAESRKTVAEIQAEAMRQRELLKSKTALSHMSPDQRWTYLNGIPEGDRNEAEQAEYTRLTKDRYNTRALGKPDMAPALIAGQTPTTPLQAAGAAADDVIGPSKSTTPVSQVPPEAVKKQFGSYEPTKYEYAIINGRLARRLK